MIQEIINFSVMILALIAIVFGLIIIWKMLKGEL